MRLRWTRKINIAILFPLGFVFRFLRPFPTCVSTVSSTMESHEKETAKAHENMEEFATTYDDVQYVGNASRNNKASDETPLLMDEDIIDLMQDLEGGEHVDDGDDEEEGVGEFRCKGCGYQGRIV